MSFTGINSALNFSNDNRSHQHHHIWRSSSQKLHFPMYDPLVELAGPQDLSEVLSACGCQDNAVDFERAWQNNDVGQLLSLQRESVFDIAVEWHVRDDITEVLAAFGDGVGRDGQCSLVMIGARPPKPLGAKRLYFSGPVATPGPALSSARALVVRAAPKRPSTTLMRMLHALGTGLPFVCDAASHRALKGAYPDVDLSALPVVEDLREALSTTVKSASQSRSAFNKIIEDIKAHRKTVYDGSGNRTELGIGGFERLLRINRLIRDSFEKSGTEGVVALLQAQSGDDKVIFECIIESLFINRSAPILRTSQSIFDRMQRSHIDEKAFEALRHSKAQAEKRRFFSLKK